MYLSVYVILIISYSLLNAFNYLFSLELIMKVLNKYFLAMTISIYKEMQRRFNKLLIYKSKLSIFFTVLIWLIVYIELLEIKFNTKQRFILLIFKNFKTFVTQIVISSIQRKSYYLLLIFMNKPIELFKMQCLL